MIHFYTRMCNSPAPIQGDMIHLHDAQGGTVHGHTDLIHMYLRKMIHTCTQGDMMHKHIQGDMLYIPKDYSQLHIQNIQN